MSGYVLVGGARGWYVAPPGQRRSYTPKLQDARVFTTRHEAETWRCGNETVVPVDSILRPK